MEDALIEVPFAAHPEEAGLCFDFSFAVARL